VSGGRQGAVAGPQADELAIAHAAQWRLQRRATGDVRDLEARLSLYELAAAAGVPIPAAEWRSHPGAVLRRFARAFAAVPGCCVTVDPEGESGRELHVRSVPVGALGVPVGAIALPQHGGTKRLPGAGGE
jgi:hypothetical protein